MKARTVQALEQIDPLQGIPTTNVANNWTVIQELFCHFDEFRTHGNAACRLVRQSFSDLSS
jgi:hypothetical protein